MKQKITCAAHTLAALNAAHWLRQNPALDGEWTVTAAGHLMQVGWPGTEHLVVRDPQGQWWTCINGLRSECNDYYDALAEIIFVVDAVEVDSGLEVAS